MKSFLPSYIQHIVIHPSTSWLISQCTEARGKQDLWQQTRPETLKSLQESAIIQSSESSNRIEGVEVAPKRLVPLIHGKVKPQDRPEEEIVGYRKALAYIHKNHHSIKVTPRTIKKLHELAQQGSVSDAGEFKIRDNEIIEILPNGERIVRFKATKASETEKALEQLCLGYNDLINQSFPDILVISTFVFDFLCIHPFRDGNGRVSRLLTLLLLQQNGYSIGQYISLERIIEESKEDYYRVLKESSYRWHESKHNLLPWSNYFFSVVKEAYKELYQRVQGHQGTDSKSDILRQVILQTSAPFKLSEIHKLIPNVSPQLIKKILSQLKKEGKISSYGHGAGAYWKVSNE